MASTNTNNTNNNNMDIHLVNVVSVDHDEQPHYQPSEYEAQRAQRVARNKNRMIDLGLLGLTTSTKPGSQRKQRKNQTSIRTRVQPKRPSTEKKITYTSDEDEEKGEDEEVIFGDTDSDNDSDDEKPRAAAKKRKAKAKKVAEWEDEGDGGNDDGDNKKARTAAKKRKKSDMLELLEEKNKLGVNGWRVQHRLITVDKGMIPKSYRPQNTKIGDQLVSSFKVEEIKKLTIEEIDKMSRNAMLILLTIIGSKMGRTVQHCKELLKVYVRSGTSKLR